MNKNSGPEFLRFVIPIVEVLLEMGGIGRPTEVTDRVLERLMIPEKEEQVPNKNGKSKIRNQIAWARFYLVKYGYIDGSIRGRWQLTEVGMNTPPSSINPSKLFKDVAEKFQRPKQSKTKNDIEEKILDAIPGGDGMPPTAETDEETEVEAEPELLTALCSLSPKAFERICLHLLDKAGIRDLKLTGGPNDQGVDGTGKIELNPFVSNPVIFQCKRFKGSVSSGEVRNFRGAMDGRTDKGIIITTGTFTAEAQKEANRAGVAQIELIDGNRLVEVFNKYEIGLRQVIVVDKAFFDSFEH